MFLTRILLLICFIAVAKSSCSQIDSTLEAIDKLSIKYLRTVDSKIEKYSTRITKKTEKTLTKLSHWENKIQGLLKKVSPETEQRLFGNNEVTFTSLLRKIKEGEGIMLSYRAQYNAYSDDVTTNLKYLADQKELLDSGLIKKAKATSNKMKELAKEEDKNEALQQFIKERKKQLIEQAVAHIGKSKYLKKINKEAYYYVETVKNYKELFADSKKTEETVKSILNKIPAFQKFKQKNSQLASLFGQPGDVGTTASMAGLQTRQGVQGMIQERIASGGPNAMEQVQQSIQEAQSQLTQLKDKLLKNILPGQGTGEGQLPDFKPNMQKTKTLLQRLEYGFNLQFAKNNTLLPTTSDIALSVGYKMNDKSIVGVGAAYKLGMGNIRNIHFSHEGIGLRSFIDWKLKKQFFISGGYELNHNAQFQNVAQLKNYNAWQRSALIGITKKLKIKTKYFKATNIQLLYDFLSNQHKPVSQPVLFRVGYSIN